MTTADAPSATTRVESSTGAILTGPEGLPARTLGWAVLAWTVRYLCQPDGPDAGKPWRFSAEQVRFLLWWYALDALGRFTYRRAIYRRSKGHGKDPLCAALALVEFLGPCRYGGTTDAGEPIAIPHPSAWVQLAAVSEAQTNNTMSLVLGMPEGSPAVEVYGLDIGKTIIYSRTGKLQTVTSSPRSMEGNRPSFALLNEVQHWLSSNDGHAMADVIRRNLGKSRDGAGRSVEICNAHVPGEESVGEKSYEAWQSIVESRSQASGVLYDSREAPATTDMSDPVSLRVGLAAAYGDSAAWVDLDRIAGEIWDPGTPACSSTPSPPGDLVTIGGDGSRLDDSTAIAACRVPDGLLDLAAVWEQPSRRDVGSSPLRGGCHDGAPLQPLPRPRRVLGCRRMGVLHRQVERGIRRHRERQGIDSLGRRLEHEVENEGVRAAWRRVDVRRDP